MSLCLVCNKEPKRSSYKYCSNTCQQLYQYNDYVKRWKLGLTSGERGIHTKNISQYIKRYLVEKFGEKCSLCNWATRHMVTGKVPLEIDHINGNAADNSESNLRLICPNCHSLSLNYRNLNKGKGRAWRKEKYIKQMTS